MWPATKVGADDAEDYNLSEHFAEIVDFIEVTLPAAQLLIFSKISIKPLLASLLRYFVCRCLWTDLVEQLGLRRARFTATV